LILAALLFGFVGMIAAILGLRGRAGPDPMTILLGRRDWPAWLSARNAAPAKAYFARVEAVLPRAERIHGARLPA